LNPGADLFFKPDCLRFLGISNEMLRRERLAMGRLWRLKLREGGEHNERDGETGNAASISANLKSKLRASN
jgi:hypothetical protein